MFLFTYTAAVLAIVCFGIAAFILARDYRDPLSRYFGLYVFFVAIWIGANAMADISMTDFSYRFWAGMSLIGGLFFIAFYICFAEHFTTGKKMSLTKKMVVFVPAIIMSCFGFTKLYVDEIFFPVNLPSQNTMGIMNYPILVYVFGGMLYAFIRLLFHIRHTAYQKKQQSIYITIGFFIFLSAAATSSIVLPFFGEYRFYTAGPQFAVFMIALAAYAIFRHNLLNVKLVVQKSVIYLILITSVVGLYLAVVCALTIWASFSSSYIEPFAILAAALFGAVGVPPLKKYLKRKTDKLFFKDHMPYADAVHELSAAMNVNLEMKDLLDATTDTLYKIFKPKKITIFLTREKMVYERDGEPTMSEIKLDSPDDFDFAPNNDDKLYINAEYDGATLAQIIVDEKKSGDTYLPEDRDIMTTFSYQFALALQKTYLFEKLKKQIKTN
jgi:hypothetical protein